MRIRTDGQHAYREDIIDDVADLWGCNKTDAVLLSCKFALQMLDDDSLVTGRGTLFDALDHPDMTPALADALSTELVNCEYRTAFDIEIEQ